MCRFLAYSGKAVLMHELLYSPKNSLIKQSISANEADEPLNGDGFGIGWYNHELDNAPGVYASIRPAWNDRNLNSLSQKIQSTCFFAHVRAASTGEVSESNCHPFAFKNLLFMHNGGIEDFEAVKRVLRRKLSDEIYNWVRGQTDSEHLFALFVHNLTLKYSLQPTAAQMLEVMNETVLEIVAIKREMGITSNDYINVTVTDGHVTVGLRYVTEESEKASTLYYSKGSRYECNDGVCQMVKTDAPDEKSVLIVSEKLTTIKRDWVEIPTNHFIVVSKDQEIEIVPFSKESKMTKAA
jgi:predicted glutamine amidotransferase